MVKPLTEAQLRRLPMELRDRLTNESTPCASVVELERIFDLPDTRTDFLINYERPALTIAEVTTLTGWSRQTVTRLFGVRFNAYRLSRRRWCIYAVSAGFPDKRI